MNIAIIGTGNVGGALATKWAAAGHQIRLGVRDTSHFKGMALLSHPNMQACLVAEAVAASEVILLSTPAMHAVDVARSLGETGGRIIIDAMNIVMGRGPEGFGNTSDAILAHTQTRDVVKCFNTTGYNNMADPIYGAMAIDLFVAGDSVRGKEAAIRLARDAGFAECYDIGGNDRFALMEQFAFFWINLAMFRGLGRDIGFKLMKR